MGGGLLYSCAYAPRACCVWCLLACTAVLQLQVALVQCRVLRLAAGALPSPAASSCAVHALQQGPYVCSRLPAGCVGQGVIHT
jgi:hypothetical protein